MTNSTPVIVFKQNDRQILLFNISAGDLKDISYFNTRELDRETGKSKEDAIQRKFDNKRSKAIAQFLESDNAILANNIIINLELEKNGIKLSDIVEDNRLLIDKLKKIVRDKNLHSEHEKVAFVVDGQHRLRAFEGIDKDNFKVPISAMVNLSLAEVAELFVQINYNQKPVNKSHVFDLLGISEEIFPKYFTLHNAVKSLQEDPKSPFYNKVKMLGVGKGFISQASLITALEKYKIQETVSEIIPDFNDSDIYDVVWHFFVAVKVELGEFWGEKKILSKTVGIRALIKLMHDILTHCIANDIEYSSASIQKILRKIDNEEFNNDPRIDVLVGEKGVSTLYQVLKERLEI